MDIPEILTGPPIRGSNRASPADFDRRLYAEHEFVAWHPDPGRAIWELEAGEAAAPAPNWFFLVGHPRTGTSVAAHLLSSHPDICCGDEHQVLPLFMSILGASTFFAPGIWYAARYQKKIPIDARNMRRLLEAWRQCVSGKPLFGDKGEMYYERFGNACAGVFPDCRFLLALRRPVDALASYVRQGWTGWLRRGEGPDALFSGLRRQAYVMLQRNRDWAACSVPLVFEQFATRDGFEGGLRGALAHLGADPERFDWDSGWRLCRHKEAAGRAEGDTLMIDFLRWLKEKDSGLGEALRSGVYELPSGLLCPAEIALPPLEGPTATPRAEAGS